MHNTAPKFIQRQIQIFDRHLWLNLVQRANTSKISRLLSLFQRTYSSKISCLFHRTGDVKTSMRKNGLAKLLSEVKQVRHGKLNS